MRKRVLIINSVCGIRSTGRICADQAKEFEASGCDVRIGYGRVDEVPPVCAKWAVRIGGPISRCVHALATRFLDAHGTSFCSRLATERFLRWAEDWRPELVWLHNIHGYYLNYELLFDWIKRHPEMEVKWTLHDCWAFTGHCAYFSAVGCDRWRSGCHNCPEQRQYPASFLVDASRRNWELKKSCFTGVKNLTLISPSMWLADLTRQSFLKDYLVEVIRNTIDTTVFKPTQSDFRVKYGLNDKIIILGVASSWDRRKGLDDFVMLREMLDDSYMIVLVGLTDKQIRMLPSGIIGIGRTNDAKELAGIYTTCDWFFNPTHEENYPTVNLEAKACGCKIITYDTGGAAETINGYDCGVLLQGQDKCPEAFASIVRNSK